MFNKFKSILEDDGVFYVLLIILVGVASFGLGRHSMTTKTVVSTHPTVSIQQVANVQAAEAQDISKNRYVGSKNGSKYHLLTCPGASQIKDENKVFFTSTEEAASKGYTPAANCEGL